MIDSTCFLGAGFLPIIASENGKRAVFTESKCVATISINPSGKDWSSPCSEHIKHKMPPSKGKKELPVSVPVSITEDALRGFSNDFLPINWVSKSQSFSVLMQALLGQNAPEKAVLQTQRQAEGKVIETGCWMRRDQTAICTNSDR